MITAGRPAGHGQHEIDFLTMLTRRTADREQQLAEPRTPVRVIASSKPLRAVDQFRRNPPHLLIRDKDRTPRPLSVGPARWTVGHESIGRPADMAFRKITCDDIGTLVTAGPWECSRPESRCIRWDPSYRGEKLEVGAAVGDSTIHPSGSTYLGVPDPGGARQGATGAPVWAPAASAPMGMESWRPGSQVVKLPASLVPRDPHPESKGKIGTTPMTLFDLPGPCLLRGVGDPPEATP